MHIFVLNYKVGARNLLKQEYLLHEVAGAPHILDILFAYAGKFSGRSISRWYCAPATLREDIPVSKRLRAGFMVNTDKEYMRTSAFCEPQEKRICQVCCETV